MYFNYYTEANGSYSDGARAKQASTFFEANYNSSADYEHKTISDCFDWVCYFYNTYLLDSSAGKLNVDEADKSNYEQLFTEISSRINSIQEEGPYNKLTLYSVVFNMLYMERKNMAQLSVSETQVLDLFDDIYNRAMALNPNKSQAQALQNEMRNNFSTYREAIEASYTARERSGD